MFFHILIESYLVWYDFLISFSTRMRLYYMKHLRPTRVSRSWHSDSSGSRRWCGAHGAGGTATGPNWNLGEESYDGIICLNHDSWLNSNAESTHNSMGLLIAASKDFERFWLELMGSASKGSNAVAWHRCRGWQYFSGASKWTSFLVCPGWCWKYAAMPVELKNRCAHLLSYKCFYHLIFYPCSPSLSKRVSTITGGYLQPYWLPEDQLMYEVDLALPPGGGMDLMGFGAAAWRLAWSVVDSPWTPRFEAKIWCYCEYNSCVLVEPSRTSDIEIHFIVILTSLPACC